MKTIGKDKYFALDLIRTILCTIMLVLAIFSFTNMGEYDFLFPYVILIGAIINTLTGIKALKQKTKGKFLLVVSVILFIIASISFLGFGGF